MFWLHHGLGPLLINLQKKSKKTKRGPDNKGLVSVMLTFVERFNPYHFDG